MKEKSIAAVEVEIACVYAKCGKCGTELTSPEGSLLLETGQHEYKCYHCEAANKLPARVWR